MRAGVEMQADSDTTVNAGSLKKKTDPTTTAETVPATTLQVVVPQTNPSSQPTIA
jgi:mannose-6-phosphate isomerase class I